MLHFSYVQISKIKDYTYKKPLLSKDCNERLVSEYRSNNNDVLIKNMPLLNIVQYDRAGCLVDYQPLDVVNEFLMSRAIEDYVLELGVTAQGLAHYFTFILDTQAQWDEEYNESDIDELYDEPRPSWLNFPRNKQGRLTYQYREGLRNLVKQGSLAETTAKQYLTSVISFYRYWLKKGFIFNNPPFDYEVVTVYFEAKASSIQAYQRKDFHTTDLRLKFSKLICSSQ
ncbi:site-specific integrase, partial [Vibrio sp. 10N.286.45.C10]